MQSNPSGASINNPGPSNTVNQQESRQRNVDGSSTGSSGGATRTLPISRQPPPLSAGYERAERARTSHACEPCRERKTKCDGERPSCRRCLHNGTTCHYGYGKGWKKRKTAEDLTATSRKLERYEELLQEIFPLVSDDIRDKIQMARQQVHYSGTGGDSPDTNMSGSVRSIDSDSRTASLSSARLPLPSIASGTAANSIPTFHAQHATISGLSSSTQCYPAPLLAPSNQAGRGHPEEDPQQQQSPTSAVRLPSITPEGIILESSMASVRSPTFTSPIISEKQTSNQVSSLLPTNRDNIPKATS